MSYLQKNIHAISEQFQNSLFAEKIAGKSGLLQGLDPRTKIICFVFAILTISFSRNVLFIIFVYFLVLILSYLSKIPYGFFITRVWLVLPFFTGFVAIPALFNVVTPGKPFIPVLAILKYNLYLYITLNGIFSALFLVTRVASSLSLAMLLILTTRWNNILKALEKFQTPKILIAIILMTYRYVFVLLKTTDSMFSGRISRLVGKTSNKEDWVWIGSSAGVLFNKTQALSEEIYNAMVSRGYNNSIYNLSDFSFKSKDYLAMIVTVVVLSVLFIYWK